MFNSKLTRKVGWLVSTSSLGLALVTPLHAGEARQLAVADTRHVVDKIKNVKSIVSFTLTPEDALKKGLQLRKQAKTPRQHRIAFEYLNYAAKQGLPEAQFQCAIMYLDNQYVPADDARAMRLLEKASVQGHKQAETALNYIRYGDDGIGC